jgi:nucleotide-binding universal stress UspA family protein
VVGLRSSAQDTDEREGDMKRQTIMVGVDGSQYARAAVRYAIAEAARRDAEVLAVCAFRPPEDYIVGYEVVVAPNLGEVSQSIEARVRRLLHEVADELSGRAKLVPVDAMAISGSPAEVLVDRSREADLLVVGHRGRGAVASAVLGSVGLRCVLHAACPVTVVPRAGEPAAA